MFNSDGPILLVALSIAEKAVERFKLDSSNNKKVPAAIKSIHVAQIISA